MSHGPSATVANPALAWSEPAAYAFTLESRCGERSLIGTFRVTVEDHSTVGVVGLDEAGRRFQGDAGSVPTLGQLLKQAEDARAQNASSVKVTSDPVDGHPVDVAIDWIADAMDDEACYRITDYVPTVDVPASG